MADFNRSFVTPDQNISKNNQEFLPFNSSPQPQPRFSPSNYSSPVKSNNFRRKNWNQSFGSNINHSQNSAGNRYSGPSRKKFNNSRNNSWSKNSQRNSSGNLDITSFLHPSFTEDPWKRLEEDLRRKNTNN